MEYVPNECSMLKYILSMDEQCFYTSPDIYHGFATYRDAFMAELIKRISAGTCTGEKLDVRIFAYNYPKLTVYEGAYITERNVNPPTLCKTGNWNLIAVTLKFNESDDDGESFNKRETTHANYILIDQTTHEIEYFEPHGSDTPWSSIVLPVVKNYFSQHTDYGDYKFIPPELYCPAFGLQAISEDALCANWSMLYPILRISCPNIPRETLINGLLQGGKDFLDHLMAKWICYMWYFARYTGIIQAKDTLDTFMKLDVYRTHKGFTAYLQSEEAYESGQFAEVLSILRPYMTFHLI